MKVAELTITSSFTGPDGHLTLMPNRGRTWVQGFGAQVGAGWISPDQVGQWHPVNDAQIRRELAIVGTTCGHRMIGPRVDAAEAAFGRLLDLAPLDLLPFVDAVAVCAPDRPGMPPRNWPAAADSLDPRTWVADHCYGPDGREVIAFNGGVHRWDGAEWQPHDGTEEWFAELHQQWRHRGPEAGWIDRARAVLAWTGSEWPAGPGEVAAADLARAVAELDAEQARYRKGPDHAEADRAAAERYPHVFAEAEAAREAEARGREDHR
ncbi:MAG: hypothetical protein QM658_04040 [Gordonia sp. (in: high G+C Gram-positive bacteria)]